MQIKNKRTHRESYEKAVPPRVRELAAGVGLPLPTWAEDVGPQYPVVSEVVPVDASSPSNISELSDQSIAQKISHAAATCIHRVIRKT